MSNIYIQEPPTAGKVLLKTTVGDIDIELWSKECPKACRNFVQLCMEGYYNNTIFHRVVKDFIVQGGDPNGDGTGGESIYGAPFKDEFHTRLRYSRRGLVGMANADVDDNGSQFFFTMAATPELQNKNTIFGKVTGDTVFNMLRLEDGIVDHNERPMYPQKILRTEILNNPFSDIVPRVVQTAEKKDSKKKREKGVKNFGLLSFGEEAEEDEEETNHFVQKNAGKAKSMHDVVDDPKLSKSAVKIEASNQSSDDEQLPDDNGILIKEEKDDTDNRRQRIKDKLAKTSKGTSSVKIEASTIKVEDSDSDEDVLITQEHEKRMQTEKKKEEIRQQIQSLKKQYQSDKRIKDELLEKKVEQEENNSNTNDIKKNAKDNEFIKSFIEEKEKYSEMKSKVPKKGSNRENLTLSMLAKFRSKLEKLKDKQSTENEDGSSDDKATTSSMDEQVIEREIQSDDWLAHTLRFQNEIPILAKDASTKGDDWYDVYDPRNPLNKRKRGDHNRNSDNHHNDSSSTSKRRR